MYLIGKVKAFISSKLVIFVASSVQQVCLESAVRIPESDSDKGSDDRCR